MSAYRVPYPFGDAFVAEDVATVHSCMPSPKRRAAVQAAVRGVRSAGVSPSLPPSSSGRPTAGQRGLPPSMAGVTDAVMMPYNGDATAFHGLPHHHHDDDHHPRQQQQRDPLLLSVIDDNMPVFSPYSIAAAAVCPGKGVKVRAPPSSCCSRSSCVTELFPPPRASEAKRIARKASPPPHPAIADAKTTMRMLRKASSAGALLQHGAKANPQGGGMGPHRPPPPPPPASSSPLMPLFRSSRRAAVGDDPSVPFKEAGGEGQADDPQRLPVEAQEEDAAAACGREAHASELAEATQLASRVPGWVKTLTLGTRRSRAAALSPPAHLRAEDASSTDLSAPSFWDFLSPPASPLRQSTPNGAVDVSASSLTSANTGLHHPRTVRTAVRSFVACILRRISPLTPSQASSSVPTSLASTASTPNADGAVVPTNFLARVADSADEEKTRVPGGGLEGCGLHTECFTSSMKGRVCEAPPGRSCSLKGEQPQELPQPASFSAAPPASSIPLRDDEDKGDEPAAERSLSARSESTTQPTVLSEAVYTPAQVLHAVRTAGASEQPIHWGVQATPMVRQPHMARGGSALLAETESVTTSLWYPLQGMRTPVPVHREPPASSARPQLHRCPNRKGKAGVAALTWRTGRDSASTSCETDGNAVSSPDGAEHDAVACAILDDEVELDSAAAVVEESEGRMAKGAGEWYAALQPFPPPERLRASAAPTRHHSLSHSGNLLSFASPSTCSPLPVSPPLPLPSSAVVRMDVPAPARGLGIPVPCPPPPPFRDGEGSLTEVAAAIARHRPFRTFPSPALQMSFSGEQRDLARRYMRFERAVEHGGDDGVWSRQGRRSASPLFTEETASGNIGATIDTIAATTYCESTANTDASDAAHRQQRGRRTPEDDVSSTFGFPGVRSPLSACSVFPFSPPGAVRRAEAEEEEFAEALLWAVEKTCDTSSA